MLHIEELHTQVEVTDPQSVLDPAVLARVVAAVLAELDRRNASEGRRRSELDMRSVVRQQRDAGEW